MQLKEKGSLLRSTLSKTSLLILFFLPSLFLISKESDLYFSIKLEAHIQWIQTFWDFLSKYGEVPGYIVLIICVATYLAKKDQLSSIQIYFLKTFVTVFLVGNVLIVQGLFKTSWGRPRPRCVIELGGKEEMRAFYQPQLRAFEYKFRSFPSGHTSIASSFFTFPLCALSCRRPKSFFITGILSLSYTVLIGWSRIALKSHFLSDVLVSFFIMVALSAYFSTLFLPEEEKLLTSK
jgi:lipid A 4'-phosphatase